MADSPNAFPKALDRAERKACWQARDTLFACLDVHQPKDSNLMAIPPACESLYEPYKKLCPAAWNEYFLKRRVLEKRKEMQKDLFKKQP